MIFGNTKRQSHYDLSSINLNQNSFTRIKTRLDILMTFKKKRKHKEIDKEKKRKKTQ